MISFLLHTFILVSKSNLIFRFLIVWTLMLTEGDVIKKY